jgi:hypothetical protein
MMLNENMYHFQKNLSGSLEVEVVLAFPREVKPPMAAGCDFCALVDAVPLPATISPMNEIMNQAM